MNRQTNVRFNSSTPFTLGVELEFQLLDQQSLNLSPMAPEILASMPADMHERIKPEFIQSMIEINTPVCHSIDDVRTSLLELTELLAVKSRAQGCMLFASSLHPFAIASEQLLSDDKRYHRIMDTLQLVGRRFITQGLHVHIGLENGETAVQVFDSIRTYLPLLLALSCSSPFYEGKDTGLHSYRVQLFEALPKAGMPAGLGSWDNFIRLCDLLTKAEIIHDTRDLWWDVRPHPDFGTIEIRICDLPGRFEDILAIVALTQALVYHLAHQPHDSGRANLIVLQSNKWEAARYGIHGNFVDPYTIRKRGTIEDTILQLLGQLDKSIEKLGLSRYLHPLKRIMAAGTSTDRQRRIYEDTGDFRDVIHSLRGEFR